MNQHGEVQAIGGVNEKIEGFFDICNERGLTGEQGVLIPASNVKHLMLRHDVVAAVKAGRFAVYPVSHVDEGIELLTGITAGERDTQGLFPEASINRLVEDRITSYNVCYTKLLRGSSTTSRTLTRQTTASAPAATR